MRLTPTDVSQFVRLEQCERYLRFRLAERAGQKFMEEYDVIPQRITPLLSLSGSTFEEGIEADLGKRFPSVQFAAKYSLDHNRPANNAEVVAEAKKLKPGQSVLLFQARMDAELHGWRLRGDVDLMRLERVADNTLHVLIGDMKSTTEAKVEHRLQVAFYRLMLEHILRDGGIAHAPVQTGILFRPTADPTPDEEEEFKPLREAAQAVFGLKDSLLEVVADPDAYLQSAHDLVLGKDSVARQVSEAPFENIPYCLSFKCDGCLYNEFCMKWSAEREDLSLLPYMTGTEKEALRRVGVTTVQALATLKDFAPSTGGKQSTELVPAPGREAQVKQIAATWPVGPRLDELVHRARSFRRSVRKDGTQALSYVPGKGNSTLPVSKPDINPNLVRIFLDAQQDYLEGRVYLLGALVVACKDGSPVGRKAVVHLTDGPPDTAAKERELFQGWTKELLKTVIELAQGGTGEKKSAPIHVVFFDRYEQRVMLEALARNFPPILEATPPLYDFLTQIAAFDSPIASFLDEEMRTFKNYPMTCQSLQSVAQYLKFDWNTPHKFREAFKARLFDNIGKLDIDGQSEWYTRRSRFASSLPLEYAYAAWGQLPKAGKHDEFADFRGTTTDLLTAFETRRLEALEHVAGSIQGNPNTQKSPFVLPDLAHYEDKAHDLAHALHEFVTIERLVALGDWKATRHAPPERRVLMGDCLLLRYVEADQEPGVAEQNRENERRRQKREALAAAFKAVNPDKQFRLNKDQSAECKWSPEGLRLRLRIEVEGVDCDLHELLLMSTLRDGDRLVLYPRLTVDERLPKDQQTEFTPTPKQMLYGPRAELLRIVAAKKDDAGRVTEAFAEVELKESRGGDWSKPYVFQAINRTLEGDKLYTLDPCPNEWYSYWCAQVVNGLCDGSPNVLYDRLVTPPHGDGGGLPGQKAFLAGLDAFHQAGLFHDFEASKREFIGGHGRTPVLLVQGPPGTGKSFSAAFAVFARLQAAMAEGRPYQVFLSCKTHAATDVLLKNVLEVQEKLRGFRDANPTLFASHFDARLLDVPLYRVAPNNPPPVGVIHLQKDAEKEKGEDYNADILQEQQWSVVGITPGGTYGMLKKKWSKCVFGHQLCDLLVLDEASQMNLPEAIMAALPMKEDAPLIVVGDHRQMPPIVKHDWQGEARRTFQQYQVYESLFDTLRAQHPPMIQFTESFRLHATMAEFLRQEVYRHDGIAYHSKKTDLLAAHPDENDLVAAVLRPDYPLVVVTHDEAESQVRNPFEQSLIEPILKALVDPAKYGLSAEHGLGIVVPHRAQRAALQQAFPELCVLDPASGLPLRSAIDTVERFQGGERTVILVSATESDRAYLLASSTFLLDPRRLTVAVSRAKRKMILVASRSIFTLLSPKEETYQNALLWKNLLLRTCPTLLWEGERGGKRVAVWGGSTEAGHRGTRK
ncbi:Superfamily I DNA and RNA helicases and helicase subunits-like [Fimbriiglobus ruber]|uniref:Superfamily I DNA and RNA helicases and helicase subunits-like n=2 Tax=Fimbriiglobus ruber TaxID=1908690 RepID=A0A225EAB8_9BACT|nr:Superfamily I DNA and RNA helicases and helicase subunits-like [Fimbriiglobus ruber]